MKADSLRDLSREELEIRDQGLREQLLKLRFQQSTGQIESPQMMRAVRKDIARVQTILRERERADQSPAEAGGDGAPSPDAAAQAPSAT